MDGTVEINAVHKKKTANSKIYHNLMPIKIQKNAKTATFCVFGKHTQTKTLYIGPSLPLFFLWKLMCGRA